MDLLFQYELHRSLATSVQREKQLQVQRRALTAAADRPRVGRPPAVRRVVGMALVRMGEQLRAPERPALPTRET